VLRLQIRDAIRLDSIQLFDISEEARNIHRHDQIDAAIELDIELNLHSVIAQEISVFLYLIDFLFEHSLELSIVGHGVCSLLTHTLGQLYFERLFTLSKLLYHVAFLFEGSIILTVQVHANLLEMLSS